MPMLFDEAASSLQPIAIVGMSCRLPGSIDSPLKFWDMLRHGRSVQSPRVPQNRFNIDAHYHPDLSRPGSFSAMGGYFLNEDPVDFDPTFFNMSPIEARWMDPQQRKVLEVCYEVLENAGIPLSRAAGSNTGVYLATFTSDYQQMSLFERDFRHNYAATGVDPGIIANRVNNFFNFSGPSCVINTACSSSVYAIHNACHALRAHDCDAAIAAGSNIIMIVDQHMNTANLGILSPTSECHTFDERADGYGRAEGVGALYLKRLSDALRDNDVIRGVIRSSSVNANGKVEGMGITFPNALGQEKALRHAYERANLDPNRTAYLECHGTGTPTGDPIEVRAVSMGMNDSRSREKPLLLGAVKANIGHSEAASGIFATMKAALMTENGQIPGVHGLETVNPKIKEKEWNVQIVKDLMPWPADFDIRRASVSSFGYGGTNAHLVIESIGNICPRYQHGKPKAAAAYDYSGSIHSSRPLLVTMSAHDETTLRRNIEAHQAVVSDYHLVDLAYTLNKRRSHFASRSYTIATPGYETEAFRSDNFSYGEKMKNPAAVGFIFTGQGAQWARMGYEAMQIFPSFDETINALDRVLSRVLYHYHTRDDIMPEEASPSLSWTLKSVLEEPETSSIINNAEISQPVCTAVQIAIVDLFASWNITPNVSVGHSSGEMAAAYASGRISAPEAILAAYFRGYAVTHAAPVGAMLAVGLGSDEMAEHLNSLPDQVAAGLTISCENSPGSVTISGSIQDIASLQQILTKAAVFNRQLKTGKAYHSPQMKGVAPLYSELYSKAYRSLDDADLDWRRPASGMISSVTGSSIESSELSISYWCDNLCSRVLFNTALTEVGLLPEFSHVNVLLEIGPHPALGGPVKQIIQSNNLDMRHITSLKRGTDSALALLRAVGELYNSGYCVDFDLVNCNFLSSPVGRKSREFPRYLPDLPHYQWNYDCKYWYQPRAVQELRESKFPRHDILGRRIFGLSTNSSTWKNMLRLRDVAWLQDHTLGTDVVFPAAGHLYLAIESLLQQLDIEPKDISGIHLRHIQIEKALMIPDDDDGIEVHTRLEKLGASGDWYTFTVESILDGVWAQHSTGKICKQTWNTWKDQDKCPYKTSLLHRQVPGRQWYRSFRRVGFKYGPSFQTVVNMRADGKSQVASANVRVQSCCPQMNAESRYLIHPSTIDGCLQVVIAAVHRGLHKQMPWGVIPSEIEDLMISLPTDQDMNMDGTCTAWVEQERGRNFIGQLQLFGASGRCMLWMKSWNFITYEAAIPPQQLAPETALRQPYRKVIWEPYEPAEEALETRDGKKMDVTVVHGGDVSSLAMALHASHVSLSAAESVLSHRPVNGTENGSMTTNGDLRHDKLGSVVIDETSVPILSMLTDDSWNSLKYILQSDGPVVWVTRGGNAGESASSGIAQGFLRTVRSESVSSRIALIDVDKDVSSDDLAAAIHQRLAALHSVSSQDAGDMEFWLTASTSASSQLWVPRLRTNDELNGRYFGAREPHMALFSEGKNYQGTVVDDEVVFEAPSVLEASRLRPREVEMRVLFAEVTKDTFSSRTACPATIVAGIVERTGSTLDAGLEGRAVVAFTRAKLETLITTDIFVVLDDDSLLEHAACVLPQLVRAVNAIIFASRAEQGDQVFLLSGSPLFEEAVVYLCGQRGLKISKLADDVVLARQSLLETENSQCTVVAGAKTSLIPEIWLAMPRGSDFVLSHVSVQDYSLDMRPFSRGVKLHVSDISDDFVNNPSALRRALEESTKFMNALDSCRVSRFGVGQLTELADIRREVNNSLASIVKLNYGQDEVKLRHAVEPVRLAADCAYLLVGCLGGLGRRLTTWMFERGCRHFAFISRSGTSKPEAAELVENLKEWGADVDVFAADASSKEAVAEVVGRVSVHRKLAGVVHAAMVLEDGLFHSMTLSAYHAALRPKMQAAIALDDALGEMPLDFFIMTSSISSVLGNPGQANYAAANSFLDYLALQRRRRGLAGTSLALPMVEDVGVVAENSDVAEALSRKMPFGIDEREMMLGFEAAIYQETVSVNGPVQLGDVQLVLGLEPPAMLEAMTDSAMEASAAFWYSDERMRPVREELEAIAAASASGSPGKNDGGGGGGDFIGTLTGVAREEAVEAIGRHVMQRAARILGMKPDGLAYRDASVASHGIDSMIGVELQSWMFREFGLRVGVQTLSSPKTTFEGLARMIAESAGVGG